MGRQVITGTWEEIKCHEAEFIGMELSVTVKPQAALRPSRKEPGRSSALGKYAFVDGGSEEFAQEKGIEIDREDRVGAQHDQIARNMPQAMPNEGMLAALRDIAGRRENRRHTDGSDTDRMLREARAGAMWGRDPTHF